MHLFQLPPLTSGKILGFAAELKDEFRRRLRELGFCEGASVELVRALPFGGPRVFRVSDAMYSLETDLARHIFIDVLEP